MKVVKEEDRLQLHILRIGTKPGIETLIWSYIDRKNEY